MCRFLAYLGPPVTLAALVLEPEHSLLRQSWAPRHQRHGTVNADGFGVGWYAPEVRPEPARYRSARPMWSDRSFASLAGVVSSGAVLAAVRNATPPSPIEESGSPPFIDGPWLFAHNGAVAGFREPGGVGEAMLARLPHHRLAAIEGASDAEVLFALVLAALDAGEDPQHALAAVVNRVAADAPGSRLNLIITDGNAVFAARSGDTLFTRSSDVAVTIASEPDDDQPGWDEVPDGSLVTADRAHLQIGVL